jgi:beta-fructofuranosidase
MDLDAGKTQLTETVSGKSYTVNNNKPVRENVPGAAGQALRFDGYSTFVNAQFNSNNLSNQALSVSLWCAMENYPMMDIDGVNTDFTYIAGNLKESSAASGFAFVINSWGTYGFEACIDGVVVTCYAATPFPQFEWVHLQATVDVATKYIRLYNNGHQVGRTGFSGNAISVGTKPVIIGKSYNDVKLDRFYLNTINGLIDDLRIYSGIIDTPSTGIQPENPLDLSIPKSRFEDEMQRPVFHAMPGAGWTNEPHGLIYRNNKYHCFFQKNGNGPYWGRIHWGHIVSNDLIHWSEVKPALEPNKGYDIKGAWSGCVFTDTELTGGEPHLFYTAVDFSKAGIAEASPLDDDLLEWQKPNTPIIPNCPDGLDDDFRDPYIFKSNGKFYMIAGSKKNGRGCATLHEYNPEAKTWSNDGRIFYQASSTAYGEFWEMPLITPIGSDKWLFAATPLGCQDGVQTLYWIGNINANGTFNAFSHTPKEVELANMSKDGFGLLSPSIMQKDGKNIVIGIVPDRLHGTQNADLGWAHTFGLPREWTLDADNNLVQKPYSGLTALRTGAETYSKRNFSLNGNQSLAPVSGRAAELEGVFKISGDAGQKFGFLVRKTGAQAVSIHYKPAGNTFTVDARNVTRLVNDDWIYSGLYESALPKTFATGETLKIHAFIDHSIMDIFINDAWAFSVRIFPTDKEATDIEIFSEGTTEILSIDAYAFTQNNPTSAGVITGEKMNVYCAGNRLYFENISGNAEVHVYDITGQLLLKRKASENIRLPENQIYIVQVIDGNRSVTKKIISA